MTRISCHIGLAPGSALAEDGPGGLEKIVSCATS
jgi:hypothetical protein